MFKRVLIILFLLAGTRTVLHAQAMPTESKAGELQIGAGYTYVNPDYSPQKFYGPTIYASFDFKDHIGIQFDFHYAVQSNDPVHLDLSEKTYLIGPRYVWHVHKFDPYAKLQIGRGVFNYQFNSANLAYNMYAFGGGLDYHAMRGLNVRIIDAEYQHWMGFQNDSLTPFVLSVGAAYHFH